MAKVKRIKFVTPVFRGAFVNVLKPQPGFDGGPAKYSITMLFPKSTDLTAMKQLAQQTAIDFFGGVDKIPAGLRNPFGDGDTKPEYDGYAGHIFVSATTNAEKFPAPGVVGLDRQPIMDPSQIYSGAWYRAEVTCFAYSNRSKGVSFGLNHIQKIRDDASFSGRGKPEEAFDSTFDGAETPAAKTTGGLF